MNGKDQLQLLWSSLLGLGAARLAVLGIVGAIVFATVGLGSYYLSKPDQETLYGGLNPQDVTRIGTVLREAGVSFDISSDGTKVMVPYGQTASARMLLAEKGLPASSNAGYELFDKLGTIGLTSFMQEITRVRALEGEIARTIQVMRGVKAARVHIVLPDNGSFRRTRQPPSASVVVRTDGIEFSSAQAIRHLVAAAIPGMVVDQVSVLSTDGTVLASAGDAVSAAPSKMMDLEKAVSRELQENVRKTLVPYLGLENFEISVAARLNLDKRQVNETAFDPESRVERSLRVVKESGNAQNQINRQSVGVEQNIPAEQPPAQAGDLSKKNNERREELTNYEVNSKTVSTTSEGYRVEVLTVAVVVNRKRVLASLGEGAAPEAVDRQLKDIERLVSTAAGIDPRRGDKITIAAVDFVQGSNALEPIPAPGILEQLARQSGGLIRALTVLGVTALLILFGLRPALRELAARPETDTAGPLAIDAPVAQAALDGPTAITGAGSASGPQFAGQTVTAAAPVPRPAEQSAANMIAELRNKLGVSPQKRLEQMVEFDELQAVTVMRQWIRGGARA